MLKETRYQARRRQNFIGLLLDILSDFPRSNALGYRLAVRNIKAKYRQSFLGILWALFPPLATASVWIILRGQGVVSFDETGVPYAVFILTGTFLWQTFSLSISTFLQNIQSNSSILVKINFPRESLLFSAFYEILFYTSIGFGIIIFSFFYFSFLPGLGFLLFFLFLFMLILLGLVLGLLLLPFSILYKDITFGLPIVLQLGLYLTPVIYPKPIYAGLGKLLELNPVTPLLLGARSSILGIPGLPEWSVVLYFLIGIIGLLLFGIVLMRISMEVLIERMGS